MKLYCFCDFDGYGIDIYHNYCKNVKQHIEFIGTNTVLKLQQNFIESYSLPLNKHDIIKLHKLKSEINNNENIKRKQKENINKIISFLLSKNVKFEIDIFFIEQDQNIQLLNDILNI